APDERAAFLGVGVLRQHRGAGSSPGAAATAAVGTDPIMPSAAIFSSGQGGNYTITYAGGTLTRNPATPTIPWADPPDLTSGAPLGPAQLDAMASVPGTFTYTPAAGTILPSGPGQVLSVRFTPADTTDYASTTGSTTINVNVNVNVNVVVGAVTL